MMEQLQFNGNSGNKVNRLSKFAFDLLIQHSVSVEKNQEKRQQNDE